MQFKVVVVKSVVLFRVKDFEQRGGRVSVIIASKLVYFIQYKNRVG